MRAFNGKKDLLGKVRERLLGYSTRIPSEFRIVVLSTATSTTATI